MHMQTQESEATDQSVNQSPCVGPRGDGEEDLET